MSRKKPQLEQTCECGNLVTHLFRGGSGEVCCDRCRWLDGMGPTSADLIGMLRGGPRTLESLVTDLGMKETSIEPRLRDLKRRGRVRSVEDEVFEGSSGFGGNGRVVWLLQERVR